jgi:hypothetical protein
MIKKNTYRLRTVLSTLVVLFVVLGVVSLGIMQSLRPTASAAASEYLNFQARLKNNSGAVVPDGDYNVEFKLYDASSSSGSSQGSCSGDSNCLWTETRTGANKVRVVNGYMTANLGSVTSLPTNIDWSQRIYLTMNIGDTGSPSWDGEMNPRLLLTAVPLAYKANNVGSAATNAASTNSNGVTISTGNAAGATSNSGNISLDTGTATGTTGTISLGASNASALTLGRSGLTTTNSGALTVTQLLTGNLGLSVTGAAISLNVSSNFDTNVNTGTSTGAVNIGNGSAGAITLQSGIGVVFSGIATDITTVSNQDLKVAPHGTGNVTIGTSDTTGTLLVLDTKTDSGDPSGTDGAIYYNSDADKFRCYQNGAWTDCIGGGGSGVTTIGAIDTVPTAANGARISGSSIFMQYGDATYPGLISTTTQDIAGAKTFSSLLTGTLGATISGATINLNASSNFATNINTGTSTGAVSIGNSAAGAIAVQSASTIGLTGTTSITGLSAGSATALTVNNSTSTGSIFVAQDNGTPVLTIANGGAATFTNQTNSTAAFQIQNAAGTNLFNVDTTNQRIIVSAHTEFDYGLNSPFGGFGVISNMLGYSEELNDFSWTTTNLTVTPDAQTSPTGIGSAEELTSTSAGGSVHAEPYASAIGSTTFSIWIKTNSGTQPFDLRIDSNGGTPTTGTAASYTATTTWKRYHVTQSFTGSPTEYLPHVVITNNSATIVAWGAQMVLGDKPGAYSKTVGGGSGFNQGDIGLSVNERLNINDGCIYFGVGDANGSTQMCENYLDSSSDIYELQSNSIIMSDGSGNDGILFAPNSATDISTSGNQALNISAGGSGDIVFGTDADTNLQVTPSAASTIDLFSINATAGSGITTDNVAGINLNIEGGNGTSTDVQGLRVNFDPITGSSDDTFTGILIDSITGTSAVENAITIGDGWDSNLFFNDTSTVIQAADATTITLTDGTNTLLTVTDVGTSASVTVTGSILASNTVTGTTATTSGTGSNTTTVTLTGSAFADGDVILIDNAGQDYYTRITAGGGTASLTVSPAVTFENSRTVTKYNIQNIGAAATGTSFTDANRFFQGYFLGGVVTGAGSTTLSDGLLQSTGALNISATSLTFTGLTSNLSIGTSDTTATLLVIDTKTDAEGGLAGTNGAMYYNSNSNKFRCYQNGAWTDCIPTGGSGDIVNNGQNGTVRIGSNDANSTILESGGSDRLTITSGGDSTFSGTLTINGLATGIAGLTVTGGTVNLNASSNNATNINTGTSTGAVAIGNSAAGAITLQSASTIGLTGTTSITGLTSGTALTISNSTSTGNILTLNDNATSVVTVADGGAALFKNSTNSTTAFQIQNSSGTNLFNVSTATTGFNLLGNPSFENGNINGWSNKGTGAVTLTSAGTPPYGLAALQIVTGTSSGNGGKYVYPFKASTAYSLSFWAKQSASSSTLMAGRQDDAATNTDCTVSPTFTVTTSWTQFSCSFTTGGTIEIGSNFYIRHNDTTSETVYIDGITLVESATPLSYSANTSGSLLQVNNNGGGSVTLLGGNSGETSAWQVETDNLPASIDRFGTASANGYVYVVGGYTGSVADDEVYYAKLNTDGSTGAWSTSSNKLPAVRHSLGTVVLNGYIYAIGGENSAGTAQSTVYYSKLNSDGTMGVWQTGTALTNTRSKASYVTYNGYLYILGGATATNDVQYAKQLPNGNISTWTVSSGVMTSAVESSAAAVANGYVYVLGGNTGSESAVVQYARFNVDGSLGTWTTNTANPLPAARAAASAVVSNGYIYALGGYDSSVATTSVYYAKVNADGSIGAWTTSTQTIPQGRSLHGSILANGYAYVIGGDGTFGFDVTQNDIFYTRLGGIVNVGGSIDLVGMQGQNLADSGLSWSGSTGGSITAGNGTFVGSLEVQGGANFNQTVGIAGTLNVAGGISVGAIDTTGTLLVLDTKSDSGDPAAASSVNGGMYYNSNAGKFRCYQNSVWTDCFANKVVLSADRTDNSGVCTIADVTGLSFTAATSTTYRFRAVLYYTAAATTTGANFSINGPSTSFLTYKTQVPTTTTTDTINHLTAFSGGGCSATTATTAGNTAIVEGMMTTSGSGTVIVRFASNVNASAIVVKAGSYIEWW